MFHFNKKSRLGRGLLLAAVVAGAAAFAAPAIAGECPADQKKPNAREAVDLKPVGVTDTTIAAIDVSKAPFKIDGRNFRMRKLVVEPGGIVPWHSHSDRPAIIYIVEGEIHEYASNCSAPLVHDAGDVVAETPDVSHWWKNLGDTTVVLLSADLIKDTTRPQHVRPPLLTPGRDAPPSSRNVTSAPHYRGAKAMSDISHAIPATKGQVHGHSAGVLFRSIVIALTAFLSLVDLFATQAILPMLTEHYGVTPGQMGLASNASTLGMLVSGLAVGYFSSSIDRRRGILISLVLLSIPTALLAYAPNLTAFAILRILQGLCMASAFTLTLAYLGEHYSAQDSASAFAAYITGNVASNLIGRLISAGVADHFGLAANFYFFALLNLAGALLVYFTVEKTPPMKSVGPGTGSHFSAWIMHLKNPSLRASFAIGFCILFAFIGTFTYVNFVLVRPPFSVDAMTLGIIYFVFLPAIATTPLAGRAVKRFGTRATFGVRLAWLRSVCP